MHWWVKTDVLAKYYLKKDYKAAVTAQTISKVKGDGVKSEYVTKDSSGVSITKKKTLKSYKVSRRPK